MNVTFTRARAVILVVLIASCRLAVAQPSPVLRWKVEATVTDVRDPLGIFADVQVGDPVHGMLKYDASVPIDPGYISFLENEPWFDVSRMTIQNPRNGTELRFETDTNGGFADVFIFNDFSDETGPFDGVFAPQSVVAPAGFSGTAPVVSVYLQGPPTVFPPLDGSPNSHLPTTLNLNDWPIAMMEFFDGWFSDPTGTKIQADIYSLTSVMAPHVPGDFDYDGDVDQDDYVGWRLSYGDDGDNYVLYADGNGDGVVDAADYILWRKAMSSTAGSGSTAGGTVPEANTLMLVALALVPFGLRRPPRVLPHPRIRVPQISRGALSNLLTGRAQAPAVALRAHRACLF